jgi:tetratricopeptide (TPR) repeat protein
MEFSDQPKFTISGVTDWTAVGGHGSDAVLRTSEELARDAATLKPDGAGAPVSSDGDRHRDAGEIAERSGDPLKAAHEFEEAARLDPSEQNYFEWGSELLLHRAVWQAVEVFAQGSKTYPKSARMLSARGAALFAGARYGEAALQLCAASDLTPDDSGPYIFLGKIALASPEPLPCVEQDLARFVQRQPNNPMAYYFYAMAVLKAHAPAPDEQASRQVVALLENAVALDPKCADGWLQLGKLSASRHDTAKAIAYYRRAIEANPQLGEAHYRLGVAYDRGGEPAQAQEQFQLHDEIEKREAERVERERREIKQFQVIPQEQPAAPLR